MNTIGLYHGTEEGGSTAVVCADPKEYRLNRRLVDLKGFVQANPGLYALRTIRKMVWRRFRNGLHATGATVQVGRKIFIDVDRFEEWMQKRTEAIAADAPHPGGTRLSRMRRDHKIDFCDHSMTALARPARVSSHSKGAPRE